MSKHKRQIIWTAFGAVMPFLITSFALLDANPAHWDSFARFFVAVWSVFFAVVPWRAS